MKNFTKLLLLLIAPIIAYAQDTAPPSIQVSTSQYTVQELVNTVLFNNSCFGTANNISFYSNNSIGYFQKNDTNFAFENGIILSTGYATDAEGGAITNPNTGDWPGDADIDNLLSQWGSTFLSHNATILEFDFTPLTNHISFDYIFASNEYGLYQCNFGDAVAFLLTDTSTNSTTNMAIIPGTMPGIPVSALTIRNSIYNSDCNSVYPEYFGNYYEEDEPKPINFTGATIPMSAESNVVPFTTYHLKIIITDTADSARDSAIFLKTGSFRIGNPDEAEISSAIGTVLCNDDWTELSINLDNDYNFQWKHNGNLIPDVTTNSVYAYEAGDYSVTVTKTGLDCAKEFSITLTQSVIPTTSINDYIIIEEDNDGHETFDLSIVADMIAEELTDPLSYSINFYESSMAAQLDFDSLGTSYINTSSTQTIFVRIQGINNNCYALLSFNISVITRPSSPIGETNQNFIEGETIENLEIEGENIKWYATENGTITIPATTALTDATTYYEIGRAHV